MRSESPVQSCLSVQLSSNALRYGCLVCQVTSAGRHDFSYRMQMQITPMVFQQNQLPAACKHVPAWDINCHVFPAACPAALHSAIRVHTWHIRRFDVPGSLQGQVDVLNQL